MSIFTLIIPYNNLYFSYKKMGIKLLFKTHFLRPIFDFTLFEFKNKTPRKLIQTFKIAAKIS